MRRFALLLALLSAACASRNVPKYSSQIEPAGEKTFVIRLQSDHGLSEEDVRRALMTEAARAAIERGAVYLRVDAVLDNVKSTAQKGTETAPRVPNIAQPDVEKALIGTPWSANSVEFSRMRTGYIRFALLNEREPTRNVFDASKLLDEMRRGDQVPVVNQQ